MRTVLAVMMGVAWFVWTVGGLERSGEVRLTPVDGGVSKSVGDDDRKDSGCVVIVFSRNARPQLPLISVFRSSHWSLYVHKHLAFECR